MTCPAFVALALLGLVPWGGLVTAEAPSPADLVRRAREGNRASIAAIRTLSCRVHQEVIRESSPGWAASVEHMTGVEYWQDGRTVRVRATHAPQGQSQGQIDDAVYRDGAVCSATTFHGTRVTVSRVAHPSEDYFFGDVRKTCLLTHWGLEELSYRTLDGLLALPHEIHRVEQVTEDGRPLVHIELAHKNGRVGLWLDPGLGYLARRTTMVPTDPEYRHEYRVVEFKRATDGAVLPVRIDHTLYRRGEPMATVRAVLTGVRLNEPLPSDAFRMPGIAGQLCYDRVRGTSYVVDADGNPAGLEVAGEVVGGVVYFRNPTIGPRPDSEGERVAPEPPAEGPSSEDLVVFAALILVAAVVAYAFVRTPGVSRSRRS